MRIVLAAACSFAVFAWLGAPAAGASLLNSDEAAATVLTVSSAVYAPHSAIDPPPSPKGTHRHTPLSLQEIQRSVADVTGDGKPDSVLLLGHKLEADSPYFDHLYVAVDDPANQSYLLFQSEGGYAPQLAFCDVNGDKAADMLVSASTGGSGGTSDYYLFSAKDNKPVKMPLPSPLAITGSLQNGYKAKITVPETGKTYTIDLRDRKKIYDEAGVYKNGRLVKPVEVSVNAFSELKPVVIDKDGVCELSGVQRITGVANADTIAYAYSVWKWSGQEWRLAKAEVVKAK
ncbi:hypothetical protein [Paenibacillus sp. MBLB4367]|uniref:hypothetical protein n=1 Tax=Paenibacillus sp. MBLB4367 TaxID=3384767 RepID=UPI0039083133